LPGEHHWVGLGTALMDDAQAATWNEAEGAGYVDDLIALNLPWLTCMRCDASAGQIGSACPGPPPSAAGSPYPHRWLATMSLELSDDEASSLADPEAPLEPLVKPRVTNVVCGLCGAPVAAADPECPERVFWLEEAQHPDAARQRGY
jgi:hypothetical protein